MNAQRQNQIAFLIGRLVVGGMYLSAGISNLLELDGKAGYVASKGVVEPKLWVILASLLLALAGASLITGIRPRIGVGALVLFLIPATLIMHNFWALDGMQRISEFHSFMSNAGLLGSALMFLAIPGPWPISLDRRLPSFGAIVRRPGALPQQPVPGSDH
jgi:putative oxidoreductase